ncbi:S1 family peptidase [Pontibacter litorisediminis]|uniref:S1 family peptidase n=1 Tax=Pontibacter litorisediminis TaxID=1846260 RepID=UPI0023EC6318|nr:serine protease [Pontibacter litorisediminis]
MRNVTDTHLTFSVLISLGSSSGSGFLYNSGKYIYLVTARHVLYNDERDLREKEIEITCQTVNLNSDDVNMYRLNLDKLESTCHRNRDVAIVKFAAVKKPSEEGKNGKLRLLSGAEKTVAAPTGPVVASEINIGKFHEVMVSNDVYLFGYPVSIGLPRSPQFDPNKPLLRKGVVANVHSSAQTIILDCPAYGGNSGGPVVQIIHEPKKTMKIIGVVSQYIPFVQHWRNDRDKLVHTEHLNSGYSVATSFNPILELIESVELAKV